jgi:hypothetical protein
MFSSRANAALFAALVLATLPFTSLAHDGDDVGKSPGQTRIALSIAKETLARHGIERPTRDQLKAALNGGTIATKTGERVALAGVLKQRASGMGWGRIAQANGFKLGEVMRDKDHRRHDKHADRRHDKHADRHHDKHADRKPDRGDFHRARFERPERTHKFERPERPHNFDRPERPHKFDRPERPERHHRR